MGTQSSSERSLTAVNNSASVTVSQIRTASFNLFGNSSLSKKLRFCRRTDFSSPGISVLMSQVGADHRSRERFIRRWIEICGKPEALIYDTTSVSTYSRELDLAEFGYHRAGDLLP